jgi:hypothetical protein
MKLADLFLNRFLYRDNTQNLETKDSAFIAADSTTPEPASIASGGAAQDINTGNVTINGAQLTPGTVPQTVLDVANWGWTQTCIFSSASATQVNWGAGVFTSAGGVSYSIGSGNTGTMSAKTYIYLDLNVSDTAYQHTTTPSTAVGMGKVLIAIAKNAASSATFNLNEASQITADNILANTIDATRMNVSQLSAITANLGTITAGTITGVLFRTATTGQRIEMDTTNTNQLRFYDSSTLFGQLEAYKVGSDGYIGLIAQDDGAGFEVYTGVGASYYSSAEIFGNGASMSCSGNASNSFAGITAVGGGGTAEIIAHGGGSGSDITATADTFDIIGTLSASNFSGSSSGTNTGDQNLSSYATTSYVSSNYPTYSYVASNYPAIGSSGTTTLNVRRTVAGVDSGWYALTFYDGVLTNAVVH